MGDVGFSIQFDTKPFQKRIDTLRDVLARRVLKTAMTAALKPMERAAKAMAPKESGLLRSAIGVKVATYAKQNTVFGVVGIDRSIGGMWKNRNRVPFYYGHLVERGTSPHFLGEGSERFHRTKIKDQKTGKRRTVILGPGRKQEGKQHPGAKASNFFARAQSTAMPMMMRTFEEHIKAALAKVGA